MRSYEGWSFGERSFVFALGLSLLWHFFWFFSISINVSPHRKIFQKAHPKVISLGPVLDDRLFKTLLQSKPEHSKAFYRRLSDFDSPVEAEVKTVERRAPGEIVSVPFGKKINHLVHYLVGGDKTVPAYEFLSRLKIPYRDEAFDPEEEKRKKLSRAAKHV